MATYKDAALSIIKDAIKSAVFIDENALEAYQSPRNPPIVEERLSVDLYNEFHKKYQYI